MSLSSFLDLEYPTSSDTGPEVKLEVGSTRCIQTVYYRKGEVVKVNCAVHANTAVLRCVDHMQLNHYAASHAEVFDNASGVLHSVVKRRMSGDIEILFKREVKKGL